MKNGLPSSAIILLGVFLAMGTSACATGTTLRGKLWIVDINTAISPFAAPSAKPDATFTTQVADFFAQGATVNNPNVNVDYTVGGWLGSIAKVKGLTFSGKTNQYINAAVTSSTLLGDGVGYGGTNGTYGTMIELTGTVTLAAQELIIIRSSDGVSVSLDGANQVQHSGPGGINDIYFWSGTAGTHSIDMLFAECCGGGAEFELLPFPRMTPQ